MANDRIQNSLSLLLHGREKSTIIIGFFRTQTKMKMFHNPRTQTGQQTVLTGQK